MAGRLVEITLINVTWHNNLWLALSDCARWLCLLPFASCLFLHRHTDRVAKDRWTEYKDNTIYRVCKSISLQLECNVAHLHFRLLSIRSVLVNARKFKRHTMRSTKYLLVVQLKAGCLPKNVKGHQKLALIFCSPLLCYFLLIFFFFWSCFCCCRYGCGCGVKFSLVFPIVVAVVFWGQQPVG